MTTTAEVSPPPLLLVDTHAHLMDAAFDADRQATIERAHRAGVVQVICPGYDRGTSEVAVALADGEPSLWAAVGIHPNAVATAASADFDLVADLARGGRVVAVGETGLDYYRNRTPPERQRSAFAWHLRLAEELGLPVVVHNREADADVAEALERSAARRSGGEVPGILHCFSSADRSYLDRMVAAGYHVSFAGPLTYRANADLRVMAGRVPLDRLLVETDAPYLAPAPVRGRRNEPAYVLHIAQQLADSRDISLDALAPQLWSNALHVFPTLALPRSEVRT